MRMFGVCDDKNTLTGLRLAGIEGKFAKSKHDVEACIEELSSDPEVAVLVITENCAALAADSVKKLKLSSTNPLLVVIPDSQGISEEANAITALIREAIGIKI